MIFPIFPSLFDSPVLSVYSPLGGKMKPLSAKERKKRKAARRTQKNSRKKNR